MTITLYFDGACEPKNPGGIATFGWVLIDSTGPFQEGQGVADRGRNATNNVAEWTALIEGLQAAQNLGLTETLVVHGDSQLVINQASGRWQCNAPVFSR